MKNLENASRNDPHNGFDQVNESRRVAPLARAALKDDLTAPGHPCGTGNDPRDRRNMVSEDQQQEHTTQPESGAEEQPTTPSEGVESNPAPSASRRVRKKVRVNVAEITPHPSIWPLALALALVVLLLGTLIHPVVQVIGAILLIGAVIGWLTERR